ncbi:MAG: hypothetical protein LPL00_01610 [Alphaproteobacteria bacterium]|nr:hypothetical protein [Alphaproteobacteria bacterium]MDX5368093.1 hypothetical protein [Alphaproteobacteria bacterium]MDX5462932.1 hypothetical protein [Alphaproteobacteria bacterium]
MDRNPTAFGKRKTPPKPHMSPAPPSIRKADERVFGSAPGYKAGVVVYDNGLMSCACRIADMTSTGARLVFDHDLALPHHFILQIPADGVEVDCFLAWYESRRMGLRFQSPFRALTARQMRSLRRQDAPRGPRLHSIARLTQDGQAGERVGDPSNDRSESTDARSLRDTASNVISFPLWRRT